MFNLAGVIPPVALGESGNGDHRSPYKWSIIDFVSAFSYTKERRNILKGFLEYRLSIYQTGVVSGFQWLNGSFVTDIEVLEFRAPNDIDVVTFFELPTGETQASLAKCFPKVFIPSLSKQHYLVDGYWLQLGKPMTSATIQRITYWYSMWSHRRGDELWKGFLEVELSPDLDKEALKLLTDQEVLYNEQ